ncbi:alpha/beta hydrolase [Lysinibacillus sp. SGAir0095]|uniref:alpha/beta hydrolase n=1 Tax=Lysinibacillus sp. SGAir0095 TaxID=2070463 RepID=UPI0010CD3E2E|nr:alpha/beta hydrolase-fold protein [Lysinibacillus sp. SGAir0095]QCR30867.1 alpha/beta hydrolase [Lysinibacillus sp. SGAir0095]
MGNFKIESKNTNYQYEVSVFVPNSEQPEEGFPVIYVLDGRSYFDYAKQTVQIQSRNSPKTRVNTAIVVGICHQENDERKRRFFDFTAPAKTYHFPEHTRGKLNDIKDMGGAENFSRFIEEELKPEIDSRYPIDKNKQTLYGHSLSGYFVLWSYLTKRSCFQSYLAISPSLWWNNQELFHFVKNAEFKEQRSVFVIVGEQEGFMVKDAIRFYDHLPTGEAKQLYIAPEENHASVVPTTMSRAFRFLS